MLRSSALSRSASLLTLLALPTIASAAEAPRPETWDMSVDELRAIGLGQERAAPIPLPLPSAKQGDVQPKLVKQGVVFVNFDAISLQQGFDDSRTDVSGIFGGEFSAFGGAEADRAAVLEAVRIDWAPYDVLIVGSRPASGDYTMNVTSPTNPIGGGVLGIAPLDCSDLMTHNNVTFAFHGAGDGFPASVVATTIGQEVAHSYGLEHVDDPSDIMNPFNAGGDPTFRDQCIPIVQGGQCAAQHEVHCGSAVSQNSHLELLELFGTSTPDTQAPAVEITTPFDGDTFDVGSEFRIEVTVVDDQAVASVQLFDGDSPVMIDTSEPYGWDVVDIPEGVYEFTVKASDPTGNEMVSNLVTVYVGVDAPDEEEGDADGSGDGDGDAGATGDDDADDDGGTDGTGGPDQDGGGDDGCGCRHASQGDWRALAFGLTVIGVASRRRRRAT